MDEPSAFENEACSSSFNTGADASLDDIIAAWLVSGGAEEAEGGDDEAGVRAIGCGRGLTSEVQVLQGDVTRDARMMQRDAVLRPVDEVELRLELCDLTDAAPPPKRGPPERATRLPDDLKRRVETARLSFDDVVGNSGAVWRDLDFLLVGEHYIVFDPGEATICHGFLGEKIKADAEVYGITDDERTLALLSSDPLIGGARDGAGMTPQISTFSANQQPVAFNNDGVQVGAWVDAQIDVRVGAKSPVRVPAKVLPFNVRPKPNGAVRVIGNKSAPPKDSHESVVDDDVFFVDSGAGRYIAANANVVKFCDRSYLQIEDLSENAAIVYAMARQCGLELEGVTSIVDSIIYRRLAPEVGAFIRAQPGPRWAALAALDESTSITIGGIGALLDKRIPELFEEFEKESAHGVSISPLELVTSALVVWLAGVADAPLRIFVYCDNESAVVVGARGRTRSSPMGVALDALRDFERRAGRRAWLVHIPGVDNVVADALSRGDQEAAFVELRRLGYEPRSVAAPDEFFTWLTRLADAARG
ncbi:hypothetical protein M885DRAFT_619915 [Pelagophyceae sp. CCMP2097]|nr:hypothetical protein M885DRAFT_619915 [Pelagophyceae sp. CCMP2097]